MTIGDRLKEERERLGYTQPVFAAIAETTKKSQIDYEKGLTQPKAGYLAAVGAVGADVSYIVMGVRQAAPNASTLSHLGPDEQLLLEAYKGLTPAQRKQLLAQILTGEAGSAGKPAKVIAKGGSQAAGRDINNKK